jgi:NAD(P)-dependent dehydrogenase (short-subunit alcohol dehydrogenase family)
MVVVITGASAGVGRATAREFARRGATIALLARNEDGLSAAVHEVEGDGGRALGIPTDVADAGQVEAAAERVTRELGDIDVWVNVAMASILAPTWEIEPAEFRRVTEVTYLGQVHGAMAALRRMRPRDRGTIVQVGSALAYRGIPLQAAYCSSKAAGRAFFESARVEHEKHDIPVAISLVLPGAINTPQFDVARQYIGKQPQPVPPIYEPEPFAAAVVHCFEHPVRELPVGWGAQKLLWGQKLSPRLGDRVLRRNGWRGQHTGEDKPVGSPDNLFDPLPGDRGAHGRFDDRSRRSTVWTSLRLRRWLVGTAAVAAAVPAARALVRR